MTSRQPSETEKLLQVAFREEIERIGESPWLTVYSSHRGPDGRGDYFCALVPDAKVHAVLKQDSWDLSIGDGLPGFSQSYGKTKTAAKYHRFGGSDGIEPLVIVRFFDGLRPDYVELLEEFRHLLNLYHDKSNDRYLRFDDNGEEEVIAQVSSNLVRVQTRPLRQFLAVKRMHLAVYFESLAFAAPGTKLTEDQDQTTVVRGDLRYSFHLGDPTIWNRPFSRIFGKRLLAPLPLKECGIWPYEEKSKPYADFIIGHDKNGKPLSHSCDPEGLANYFGKNPGAPHFLTPVVFRRDVLRKYYDHPERYSVEDGYLRCAGRWGLRMDNHSEDRVTVFLGDLGETLGHEEQLYWRSFNIPPRGDGKDLSATTIRRAFAGEFADATTPELVFKSTLTAFQERWEKRFGWDLVRPLRAEDAHVLKKLRAPTTLSVVEFEDQLLGLTKLLVDSLNDKDLAKELGGSLPDEKSIAKFDRFLNVKGYPDTKRDIELLRLLQEARSSMAAHRKGDSFKKVSEKLGLSSKSTQDVFSSLLTRCSDMLKGLLDFFDPVTN